MQTFNVYIRTPYVQKGNEIRTTVPARDHEEAMNQILLTLGLDYGMVDYISVESREKRAA